MHTTPVQSHSSFQELPILGSSPSTHKEYGDKDAISSKVCSREFGEYTTVCTQCKRVFVPYSMVKGIPIRTSKEDGEWIKCDEFSSSNKPINTSHGLCRECFANMDADLLLSNPSPRRNLLSKSLSSPEVLRHLPSRPKRVLIVDDNRLQRQIHQRLVEQAGFDCDVACSGAQALELVQKHTYCLVLVDLVMAPMDGWTTTRKIRNYLLQAIGFASALPRIVAVTGLTIDKDLLKRCTESGIDDALHKPIDAAVLKKVLPVGNVRIDR